MQMAKDEGWSTKNGSKWKTMPEQMLRYRSASFFGRIYAPEILMGFKTTDEVEDMQHFSAAKEVKAEVLKPEVDFSTPGTGFSPDFDAETGEVK